MKIRTRLVLGLLAIAVVLVVPFLFMLRELDSLRRSTRRLQQTEFAGSLLAGVVRNAAAELRQAEAAVAFGRDSSSADALSRTYTELRGHADSLGRLVAQDRWSGIDSVLRDLETSIREHEAVARLRQPEAQGRADSILQLHLQPAIRLINTQLPLLERELNMNTDRYFAEATAAAEASERVGMLGLAIATALALAISVWLTRSISEPVRDLQKAMQTVADGDYSYPLRSEGNAPSEFAALSRSYRSMVGQLAELDKLKAEFVSVASHELRTPINVVTGYLELLDEGAYGELNPKQREILRLLEEQSRSLTRLVQQLLDVSRFEAGGGRLETRPVNLQRFLNDLRDAFSVLAQQKQIGFRVVAGDNLPERVEWDEDRIREVLGNLLSNAFKFTSAGGTVEVLVYDKDGGVRLEVNDTGVGITAEQIPRIFEKFYQVDGQKETLSAGTGLGLAIAREIVEAHQGSITVESTPGLGTKFVIALPRVSAGGRRAASRRRTPAVPQSVAS
jgi:signal transduction histidine kinase